MKYLLIYNPNSGSKKSNEKEVDQLCNALEQQGHEVELAATKAPNHATELACKAVETDTDVIVAIGGDGTVNEVAIALRGTGKTLGIIPTGSGNGLARELCIPMEAKEATEILLRHQVKEIDTCEANGEPFFVTCGIGFDGKVSDEFAQSESRGATTYVKETLSLFLNYEPADYHLTIDGEEATARAFLIAVANASQYGNNAYIAPTASITDGMLDVTIIKEFPPVDGAKMALQLFLKEIDKNEYTTTYQGQNIVIASSHKVPYHIDGEPKEATDRLEIKVSQRKLKVIAGTKADKERTFFDLLRSISNKIEQLEKLWK